MSGRHRSRFVRLPDETGHGIARLRALAHPIPRPLQIQRHIVALLERLVGAEFLDTFAIARTAGVSDDDTKRRFVLRADALHANFYCHKSINSVVVAAEPRVVPACRRNGLPSKRGRRVNSTKGLGKSCFSCFS